MDFHIGILIAEGQRDREAGIRYTEIALADVKEAVLASPATAELEVLVGDVKMCHILRFFMRYYSIWRGYRGRVVFPPRFRLYAADSAVLIASGPPMIYRAAFSARLAAHTIIFGSFFNALIQD